jgi:hypothetical protein
VLWAGEDEGGLLVAGIHGLARLRPGEPAPRQLASTRFVIHYALGPRGVVWLERSGERTAVWWIETGQESPRRIAESVGAPYGIVAHEGGVYWGTDDSVFDPDNPKVRLRANGRIFFARFEGGPPVEVVHRDWHIYPCFADSRGVAWHEISSRPALVRIFEATVAGVAETTQFSLATGRDEPRGPAMTIDASAVYLHDRRAGGLVAVPRRGGEPRLLTRSRPPALALASHDGALYAIIGDARGASREIWRVDLATSEVKVLGHFVTEDGPRHGLAIGRNAVYVYGGRQILSVPRVL